MRILAVLAHPRRQSYCGALLDALTTGARAAHHEVDVLDLHAEDSRVGFGEADLAQMTGGALPADVRAAQERMDAAGGLAIVYPIYWWTFPAVLRGWVDRVWSLGWAYRIAEGPSKGLLRNRPTVVLASAGVSRETFETCGYASAMQRLIDDGLFRYCGIERLHTEYVFDVHESDARRRAGIVTAERLGREFFVP